MKYTTTLPNGLIVEIVEVDGKEITRLRIDDQWVTWRASGEVMISDFPQRGIHSEKEVYNFRGL